MIATKHKNEHQNHVNLHTGHDIGTIKETLKSLSNDFILSQDFLITDFNYSFFAGWAIAPAIDKDKFSEQEAMESFVGQCFMGEIILELEHLLDSPITNDEQSKALARIEEIKDNARLDLDELYIQLVDLEVEKSENNHNFYVPKVIDLDLRNLSELANNIRANLRKIYNEALLILGEDSVFYNNRAAQESSVRVLELLYDFCEFYSEHY